MSVYLFVRDNIDDVTAPYTGVMQVKELERGVEGTVTIEAKGPVGPYVGPCDIGFMARTASGTADVEIDFELLLVDN